MLNEYYVGYNVKRSSTEIWSFSNVSTVLMSKVVTLISDHGEQSQPEALHKLREGGTEAELCWKSGMCLNVGDGDQEGTKPVSVLGSVPLDLILSRVVVY